MNARSLRLILGAAAVWGWPGAGFAACAIPESPCYPWRIDEAAADTTLLEIIPNNAVTDAIYRVCVCAPAKGVSVVFDYGGNRVGLGRVEAAGQSTICRDFRIQTSRKSRLLLRRQDGTRDTIEGCYTAL